jgi:CTP synthase
VVEFARNQCGIQNANSAEFKPENTENVIDIMEAQKNVTDKGGTMRLGAYSCQVLSKHAGKSTRAYSAYGKESISERHRHRFEVSNRFRPVIEEKGLVVSGKNVNKETGMDLVEMVELSDHPWFLGCQFHPELKSQPLNPHPLFASFIKASKDSAREMQKSFKGMK